MRILITGINGFVAQHFLAFLATREEEFTILGVGRSDPSFDKQKFPRLNIDFIKVDLLNREQVGEVLKNFKPQYLLHLASVSSVGHSWKYPNESFVNNTNIFLNLVDQIRLGHLPAAYYRSAPVKNMAMLLLPCFRLPKKVPSILSALTP